MQYYLSHIISLVIFSFALSLLVVGTTAAQCGKDAGGAQCPEGMCCSNYGYCGTSQDYCGPGHCQSQCPSPPSPPFTGRCGKDFGGAQCPQGMCCSNYGYCGTSLDYCGPGHCQSQCPSPPPPPPPFTPPPPPPPFTPPPPISPDDVSHIITEEIFEEFLLHRNDGDCEARGFYTYEAFLTAARRFPNFGTTGSLDIRKRELAAFFGQTSHETTGGWDGAPDGRYAWGYCYIREQNRGAYCHYSVEWPCVSGQLYYGRGPIQLTSNLNYGPAGEALGLDLLSNPDLVATDQVLTFEAAMWFWMTPRDNKPSCHDVITEQWTPTEADLKANRHPGYGVITNIINGGIECGNKDHVAQVEDRIGFYERYLEILGVEDTLGYLDCYDQLSFASGLMDPKYEKVLKMYVDLS